MDGRRVSAEVALILACCRWPRSEQRNAAVRAAAVRVEWTRFLATTQRHRVEGLVYDGLLAAEIAPPEPVRSELREHGLRVAGRGLVMARGTLAIAALFENAGIPALFVKGSSLEILAYGRLGLKSANDIDVLVERDRLAEANAALHADGWTRTLPPADLRDDLLERYLDLSKDLVFVHEARGLLLELHHCLAWHDTLARVNTASPRQDVAIFPGRTVPTLSDEELFIYLSVHGGLCQWMRIKWLADLGGFLAAHTPAEIDSMYQAACARGADAFAGQALRLCHILLATPLSAPLLATLEADRSVRRLCAGSLAAIERPRAMENKLVPIVRSFFFRLRMHRGWRARVSALGRGWLRPADLGLLRLPRRLFFLYYLARVPLLIVRRASGWLR